MNLSLGEIFNHGGGAMWVILAFSIIALAVAIDRAIVQWRFIGRARELATTVFRCLGKGSITEARTACERSGSPLADVFVVGFERARGKRAHLSPSVHRERVRVAAVLRSRMWMLATIGATAPFVGLFGTVVGIMEALGRFDSSVQVTMGMVAGPISGALVVTAAGILVAVEAVLLFNYFNQRAAAIGLEMRLLTDEFLEDLSEAADGNDTTMAAPAKAAPITVKGKKVKPVDDSDPAEEKSDGDR